MKKRCLNEYIACDSFFTPSYQIEKNKEKTDIEKNRGCSTRNKPL